mmetsp:Transcript_3322/g.4972  ORF Transcript_3322/g.4972 Transcript_3322/m.4972 type:complete len:103 (-) Transcript_3322:105-413(-)|eukprot:CAMPEP_0196248626 /NCGR_PEP_ID=MMETSP0913-20130531/40913_1 /TAXON_ID=49265 /ORGANISM="Thalassiosira rotula, Strain GSO102" /LENGTH=102 /DNA_ID=CAMNT_0041533959 /DNA_START=378 /DNA_END=686 /DNA_ORIENTATION=+
MNKVVLTSLSDGEDGDRHDYGESNDNDGEDGSERTKRTPCDMTHDMTYSGWEEIGECPSVATPDINNDEADVLEEGYQQKPGTPPSTLLNLAQPCNKTEERE